MEWLVALVGGNRKDSAATELISGAGELNESGLEDFINSVKVQESSSYSVVAIMGPQNSGKSTLLNHLFKTRFTQRNPSISRAGMATTTGVWIDRAHKEPLTLVLDLEGTDGKERGLDGTTFEKQSALFALQLAHTLLINMWSRDFGREQASYRPLLRTIFEVVVTMPTFPRKRTLLFVVRDMNSYDESLETPVREDVQKIWEEVQKPEGREDTPLTELFNVEFFALSNYRERRKEFEKEVNRLRQQIINSISHRGDKQWVVPASRFCSNTKEIWTTIKQINNLHLPAHKVMVATARCEEIVKGKLALFASNQDWVTVQEEAETRIVSGFGARISSILSGYLSEYESESLYLEENVRKEKRQYLESEVMRLVHPAYTKSLGHLRSEQLQSFKTQLQEDLDLTRFAESARRCQQSCVEEFVRQCSGAAIEEARWDDDASTECQQLVRDIEDHKLLVTAEALHQVVNECRDLLCRELKNGSFMTTWSCSIENLSWEFIRRFLSDKSDAAISEFRSAVESLELEQTKVEQKVNDMRQYARQLVGNYFRDLSSESVVELMTLRYYRSYLAQTQLIANEACRESLKILSIVAAIRLDEGDDNIERVLVSELMPPADADADADGGVQPPQDPLDATEWPQLPPQVIALITPIGCKDIWNQFKDNIDERILPTAQIIHEEMTRAAGNDWVPPDWVIVGLLALGITPFLRFLRFSNLNVLLVVLKQASQGITLVIVGRQLVRNVHDVLGQQNIDFNRFQENHSNLIENIERCLRQLYENVRNRSSIEVAA